MPAPRQCPWRRVRPSFPANPLRQVGLPLLRLRAISRHGCPLHAAAPPQGPPAEAPAPDPGASAVQQELLRIGAAAGLDVGSAEGPVAGWLGSGTPQQQANRVRLVRVLTRCVRELQTDGTDPKLLPALHECEDRALAQGGQ